jgi:tetratricopeptide (TPR) repeat protein
LARYLILVAIITIPQLSPGQERANQFIDLAQTEILNKDYTKALVHLDSAATLSPSNAEIDMIRAEIYKTENKLRKALESYDNAVRKNPGLARAYYERSILRNKMGDHRNYSLDDINAALKSDPENIQYYVKKAYYLSSINNPETGVPDYSDAIEVLSSAISMAPDSARLYSLRGRNKFELNQILAAMTDFTKAIELDSTNAVYYDDRGLIYLITMEDYPKAIIDFTSAIDHDPLNEEYIQKRGHAKFNSGEYIEAIDDFTLAINTIYRKLSLLQGQISPGHPLNKNLQQNYILRGYAFLQDQSTYEACTDFKAARGLGSRKAANYVRRYCN